MSSHYFIGIQIPPHIASSIIEARERTNLHETHKTLPVAEDLHITLYYLGEMGQNLLDQINHSLQTIEWNPFELTTRGLAHFGSNITPRVVYTSLEESDSLMDLQRLVQNIVSNYIEIIHSKDFNAHITIAKKWASNTALSTDNFLLSKQSFEVNNFTIYKINMNSIPRYEKLSLIQYRRVT